MPVSESRKKANAKWDSANLDRMSLALPKGKKELIKKRADALGMSVNSFINSAIDEKIEKSYQLVKPEVEHNEGNEERASYVPMSADEFEENRQRQLAALQAMIDKKRG